MIYTPTTPEKNANDIGMKMLMDKEVDAIWIYADQANLYDCDHLDGKEPGWDCDLWNGLGTKYAYIATGMFGHARNGTTLTASKRGSGMNEIVNPCLRSYMQTKEYLGVCEKYGQVKNCFKNVHFPAETK